MSKNKIEKTIAIFGEYSSGKSFFIENELEYFLKLIVVNEKNNNRIDFKKKIILNDLSIDNSKQKTDNEKYSELKSNIYFQMLNQIKVQYPKYFQTLKFSEIMYKKKSVTLYMIILTTILGGFLLFYSIYYPNINFDDIDIFSWKFIFCSILINIILCISIVYCFIKILKSYKIRKVNTKFMEFDLNLSNDHERSMINVTEELFISAFSLIDDNTDDIVPIIIEDIDRYNDLRLFKTLYDIAKISNNLIFIFALDKYIFSENCTTIENGGNHPEKSTHMYVNQNIYNREIVTKFFDHIIEIPTINNYNFIHDYNSMCGKLTFDFNSSGIMTFDDFIQKIYEIDSKLLYRINSCFVNVREKQSLEFSAYLSYINNKELSLEAIYSHVFLKNIFIFLNSNKKSFDEFVTDVNNILDMRLVNYKDKVSQIKDVKRCFNDYYSMQIFIDNLIEDIKFKELKSNNIKLSTKLSNIFTVSYDNIIRYRNNLTYEAYELLLGQVYDEKDIINELAFIFSQCTSDNEFEDCYSDFHSNLDVIKLNLISKIQNYYFDIETENGYLNKLIEEDFKKNNYYIPNNVLNLLAYISSKGVFSRYSNTLFDRVINVNGENQKKYLASLTHEVKILQNDIADIKFDNNFISGIPPELFNNRNCINSNLTQFLLFKYPLIDRNKQIFNSYFNTLYNEEYVEFTLEEYYILVEKISDISLLKNIIKTCKEEDVDYVCKKYIDKINSNNFSDYTIDEFDITYSSSALIIDYIDILVNSYKLNNNSVIDLGIMEENDVSRFFELSKNTIDKLLREKYFSKDIKTLDKIKSFLCNTTQSYFIDSYTEYVKNIDIDNQNIESISFAILFENINNFNDFIDFPVNVSENMKVTYLRKEKIDQYKIIFYIIYKKLKGESIDLNMQDKKYLRDNVQFCPIFSTKIELPEIHSSLSEIFKWLVDNKFVINNYLYRIENNVDFNTYFNLVSSIGIKTNDYPIECLNIDQILDFFTCELDKLMTFHDYLFDELEVCFNKLIIYIERTKSKLSEVSLKERITQDYINHYMESDIYLNSPIENKFLFLSIFLNSIDSHKAKKLTRKFNSYIYSNDNLNKELSNAIKKYNNITV